MSELSSVLADADGNPPVVGDDFDCQRTVTSVPADDSLETAWMMVKRRKHDTDANAIITKEITSSEVDGQGQITDDGTTDHSAVLFFQLTAADTALLSGGVLYYFGIKVKTTLGKYKTVELGAFVPAKTIVQAT